MTWQVSQMTTAPKQANISHRVTKDNTIAEHKQKLAAQHDCERTFQARQGLTKENKFQGLMEQGVSWNINSWMKPYIEKLGTVHV